MIKVRTTLYIFVVSLFLWPVTASAQQPYQPQPGDIIASTNPDQKIQEMYRMLGAGPPTHVALVTYVWDAKAGRWRLVILESLIETGVIASEFSVLHERDRTNVQVRSPRRPLGAEESTRLARWATAQLGKPYPRHSRVYVNAIRGRPERILHRCPKTESRDWFCSGLVAAGLVTTGRVDGHHVRPDLVMPIDVIDDARLDLSPGWTEPKNWSGGRLHPSTRIP